MDFKTNSIKEDKGGYNKMIKGLIQKADTKLVNMCAPNVGAPKYIK